MNIFGRNLLLISLIWTTFVEQSFAKLLSHSEERDDSHFDDFPAGDEEEKNINAENVPLNSIHGLDHRLPQAIIIGVKKGGTRALLEYLRLHPLIRAPGPETHFFDRYYDRGLEWYRKQMPLTYSNQTTVEKTPCYFVRRDVPKRIYDMNPNTKLILVLRDPVTRAVSDYTQSHSKGRALDSFQAMAFIDKKKTMVDQKWSAIRIGVYIKHLRKWLPYFALQQIHVVSGEKLITDPIPELRMVEDFLGISHEISGTRFKFDSIKGFPCVKRKQTDIEYKCLGKTKGRIHPKIGSRCREKLRRFYWSYNHELFSLLGRDFAWNDLPIDTEI